MNQTECLPPTLPDMRSTLPSVLGGRSFLRRLSVPTALVVASLLTIGLLRLWTLGTLALTDNTEARYAGISWHMFRSGDWITPRVYLSGQLVPFWAKPPLFFWLTSLSFLTCGASEWAARLPNFLIAAAVVGLTILFGRRFWGPRVGAIAGVILASSGLFFVLAGSCILDMSLAGSICLALMSFALFAAEASEQRQIGGPRPPTSKWWAEMVRRAEGLIPSVRSRPPRGTVENPSTSRMIPQIGVCDATSESSPRTSGGINPPARQSRATWWGCAFWFSLGLGCLAKGPVAVVLVGLTVAVWIAVNRQWFLLRRLPWVSGSLILAAVACPWYFLAERATPGFLHYFLLNEHLLRYVRSEYGDLYGAGRTQPYGASWLMLAVTFLPWTPVFATYAWTRWRNRSTTPGVPRDAWLMFALMWGLTPAVFFTFCRQILVTYLLPGFPGLALAAAVLLNRWLESHEVGSLLRGLRATCLSLIVLVVAALSAEFVLGVAPVTIAGSVAVTLAFAAIVWYGHTRASGPVLIAATGQGTALLIAMALFAVAPWVEEAFSTKTILAAVAQLPDYSGKAVFIPFGDDYSADFYQEAWLGRRLERDRHKGLRLLVDKLHAPDYEVFVFRRKEWQELEGTVRGTLSPITETAHWVACRVAGTENPEHLTRQAKPTREL
jgi:4-amino-4-deoxy-L-arabinose transferase-like glycosyltransferase